LTFISDLTLYYSLYCIAVGTQSNGDDATTSSPTSSPIDSPTSSINIKYGLQDDCKTNDESKYNICLDLKSTSGMIEPWMDSFSLARARWEEVIVDDDGMPINIAPYVADPALIATELPDMVDDVYIAGSVVPVDGKGGILGMAGPTVIKDWNGAHPLAGVMKFDEADVQDMINSGTWTNVILHEMGHVLGIGTLWNYNEVHSGSNDKYKGSEAKQAWKDMGCSGRLPVETDGGSGTAGGHWDETCLDGELMTGYVEKTKSMPLSRLTIASLQDMGYGVNLDAADEFSKDRLGNCGSYCPEARRQLRVGRQARPLAERKGRDRLKNKAKGRDRLKNKAKVSKEGHATILEAAAKEMQKAHAMKPRHLPDGMRYVADQFITFYILDNDGEVKEETVTWEDTRRFLLEGS
jgi:hypothetical protein